MRLRLIVLLLLAGGAAFGAANLARDWMDAQTAAFNAKLTAMEKPEEEMRSILVAREPIPAGTFVREGMVRWAPWPEDGIASSYFVRDEDTIEDLQGAVVRTGLTVGEPLTTGRIVRPGERGFLSAVLRAGMRAVTVPVNATTGIGGFVFPGDQVDLLLTHRIQQSDAVRRATETVLHDIRVLAVDQRVNDHTNRPEVAKTATLEVTPKQAEIISVAMEMGTLSLVLRSLMRESEDGVPVKEPNGPTHTWDSQASRLLIPPSNRQSSKNVDRVEVVRRGEATTLTFSRSQ